MPANLEHVHDNVSQHGPSDSIKQAAADAWDPKNHDSAAPKKAEHQGQYLDCHPLSFSDHAGQVLKCESPSTGGDTQTTSGGGGGDSSATTPAGDSSIPSFKVGQTADGQAINVAWSQDPSKDANADFTIDSNGNLKFGPNFGQDNQIVIDAQLDPTSGVSSSEQQTLNGLTQLLQGLNMNPDSGSHDSGGGSDSGSHDSGGGSDSGSHDSGGGSDSGSHDSGGSSDCPPSSNSGGSSDCPPSSDSGGSDSGGSDTGGSASPIEQMQSFAEQMLAMMAQLGMLGNPPDFSKLDQMVKDGLISPDTAKLLESPQFLKAMQELAGANGTATPQAGSDATSGQVAGAGASTTSPTAAAAQSFVLPHATAVHHVAA
jgi:hypothetical protein